MLTEIQSVILTCLLGPEDPGAFRREQGRLRKARQRLIDPEPSRAAGRKCGRKRRRIAKPEGVRPWGVKDPAILSARREARIAYAKQYRIDNPGGDAIWRENNKESVKETGRKQYLKNREKRCLEAKEYRRTHREEIQELEREKKKRNRKNPQWRLVNALRTRLRDALRGSGVKKSVATMDLLGCPVAWLQVHLESLFKPGMTWENRGSVWHVDHVKPCAKFDLSNPEQQRICFHWTNLQPLFATENLKKGDKYVG